MSNTASYNIRAITNELGLHTRIKPEASLDTFDILLNRAVAAYWRNRPTDPTQTRTAA